MFKIIPNNSEWPEKEIKLSQIESSAQNACCSHVRGPIKLFSDSNERNKLRRVNLLIFLNSGEELMHANHVCLNTSGKEMLLSHADVKMLVAFVKNKHISPVIERCHFMK